MYKPVREASRLVQASRRGKTTDDRRAFRKLVKAKAEQIRDISKRENIPERKIIERMWYKISRTNSETRSAASVSSVVRELKEMQNIPAIPYKKIGEVLRKLVKKAEKGNEAAFQAIVKIRRKEIEDESRSRGISEGRVIVMLKKSIMHSKITNPLIRANVKQAVRGL